MLPALPLQPAAARRWRCWRAARCSSAGKHFQSAFSVVPAAISYRFTVIRGVRSLRVNLSPLFRHSDPLLDHQNLCHISTSLKIWLKSTICICHFICCHIFVSNTTAIAKSDFLRWASAQTHLTRQMKFIQRGLEHVSQECLIDAVAESKLEPNSRQFICLNWNVWFDLSHLI